MKLLSRDIDSFLFATQALVFFLIFFPLFFLPFSGSEPGLHRGYNIAILRMDVQGA